MSIHNILASRGNILHGNSYTGVTDSAPYLFRPTGGDTAIGDAKVAFLNKLVGGTVAWNQLLRPIDDNYWEAYNSNFCTASFSNGVATITKNGTVPSVNYVQGFYLKNTTGNRYNVESGHKYLIRFDILSSTAGNYAFETLKSSATSFAVTANVKKTVLTIQTAPTSTTRAGLIYPMALLSENDYYQVSNYNLIDLTAAFGTAIADYAYTLESGTAGAGIAWLKSQGFDLSKYHAFNAGSLESVYTNSHKEYGFNQWDEEWEIGTISPSTGQTVYSDTKIRSKNYIPVLANTNYHIHVGMTSTDTDYLYFYDANKAFISALDNYHATTWDFNFATPNNVCYMKFISKNTTYNNDICINVNKPTGTPKNGDYVPHTEVTYPITPNVLRGVLGLDANNNITYNGDEQDAAGNITRKYGIVDMGSLAWEDNTAFNGCFRTTLGSLGYTPNSGNLFCPVLVTVTSGMADADKAIYGRNNGAYVFAKDSAYATAADFKTAVTGKYMIFSLVTPTTETTDPYTNPQTVFVGGTEEFTDYGVAQGQRDVAIPVGHVTEYYQEAV